MYRSLTLLTFLILLAHWARGQTLTRHPSETVAQFVECTKPIGSRVTHEVLETIWNRDTVIVAFYQVPLQGRFEDPLSHNYEIIATLLRKHGNTYYSTLIDTIGREGGDAEIQAYFFANMMQTQKRNSL